MQYIVAPIDMSNTVVIMEGLRLGSGIGYCLSYNHNKGPWDQKHDRGDLDPLSSAVLAYDGCLLEHLAVAYVIETRVFF